GPTQPQEPAEPKGRQSAETEGRHPAETNGRHPAETECREGIPSKVPQEGTPTKGKAPKVSFPWNTLEEIPPKLSAKLQAAPPGACVQSDGLETLRREFETCPSQKTVDAWAAVFTRAVTKEDREDERAGRRKNDGPRRNSPEVTE